MFPKIIKFSGEGRTEINKGVNILANAVKSTLGPQGRNVLIGNKGMKVRFTKDGVSVAKEVCLYDEIQDAGVNI
jgi:chaperonin GroEL